MILIADCTYGQKTACCAIALNYSCYQVRACVFLDQSIDFARSAHRTVREVCGKTQNTIRIHLSWEMNMRAAEAARIKRNVKILEGNLFNMAALKADIHGRQAENDSVWQLYCVCLFLLHWIKD